jgi:hypothetical protein
MKWEDPLRRFTKDHGTDDSWIETAGDREKWSSMAAGFVESFSAH